MAVQIVCDRCGESTPQGAVTFNGGLPKEWRRVSIPTGMRLGQKRSWDICGGCASDLLAFLGAEGAKEAEKGPETVADVMKRVQAHDGSGRGVCVAHTGEDREKYGCNGPDPVGSSPASRKAVGAAREAAAEVCAQAEKDKAANRSAAKAAKVALANMSAVNVGALVERDGFVRHVVPDGAECREHSGLVRKELRCDASEEWHAQQ